MNGSVGVSSQWDGDKNDFLTRQRDGRPKIHSSRFRPNPDVCCEACVFKRGEHSAWCENVASDSPALAERDFEPGSPGQVWALKPILGSLEEDWWYRLQ